MTRGLQGKTVTKVIPADCVDESLKQIDRYRELQRLMHEYTELNVKICDALIERSRNESDSPEGAREGSSTQNSGNR